MTVSPSNSLRVGIDVGGTFTDLTVAIGDQGGMRHFKVPSTPEDPSIAIYNGLKQIFDTGYNPQHVTYVGHGTTVATNIIIERRGTLTGLVTTKGQRDVLEIARQQRPHLYDYSIQRPRPLVDRALRIEIDERITADGKIVVPLDEAEITKIAEFFRASDVKAVAVCFLHSYRFPEHEQKVGKMLRKLLPEVAISLSSEVQPEFREFERFSTTVMNSYLMPKLSSYLDRLEGRCRELGVTVSPYTVHSNGGLMSLSMAREFPVRTCLSGPAAGVVGGAIVAGLAGFKNAITFDVGGTSTDVSLIVNGRIAYTPLREVAGYPVRCPMIDVHVIGAGGGSIAWLDQAGGMKVGPQSTAADPGPAGYGKGGKEATLTDANILLGRLNQKSLLDGELIIDANASRAVIQHLESEINGYKGHVADGIVRIAVANMARAIRSISVERGSNLKDYVLVAFGGAGPLHAAFVADESGIQQVLVPVSPGTMCARGVLLSNISRNFVQTIIATLSKAVWLMIETETDRLREEAQSWLNEENIEQSNRLLRRIIEARYVGQNYEVRIEAEIEAIDQFVQEFHSINREVYGYDNLDRPIEIVNLRIEAIGITGYKLTREPQITGSLDKAWIEKRMVDFGVEYGGEFATPVYRRSELPGSTKLNGPAIIEELSSTTVLPPGWSANIDAYHNIILKRGES